MGTLRTLIAGTLFAPWLLLVTSSLLFADVSPGDVIDKSTWEKAEGLLPQPVLDWVKKGEYVLQVGELHFDQGEFFAPAVKESLTKNVGRYAIDGEGQIVEAKTGDRPGYIEGFPFPVLDPNDPKAAVKAMYNKHYHMFSFGNIDYPFQMIWAGKGTGFEREISCVYLNAPLEGCPKYKEKRNPDDIQRYTVLSVRSPFDVKGTSVMLWRYKGAKQDTNFAYVPAIRRVRRTSPANRSDSFVGSDCCVDDAWGYDGKINAFDWKLIRVQEVLVPYKNPDTEMLVPGKKPGEWETVRGAKPSTYGYQTEGWQGAPWAPMNFIWVKRPVWVIESKPKDPYYNYGSVQIWYDPELHFPKYGLIFDRAGDYWKTFLVGHQAFQSEDGQMKLMLLSMQHMVDDRTQHSSFVENYSDRNIWTNYANMDLNDFSLAGFMKFCK